MSEGLAERIWEAGTRAWYEHKAGSNDRTEALDAIRRVLAEHSERRDAAMRGLVEAAEDALVWVGSQAREDRLREAIQRAKEEL